MLYLYLGQERAKELRSPSRETQPFFGPFRPKWKTFLADAFYVLARKLEPKRYAQSMRLEQN